MIKRLGLILGTSVALLVGCEDESDWKKVEGAEITEFNTTEECGRYCYDVSVVTLKKDGNEFRLDTSYSIDVELLYVGQIIDIYYDSNYSLMKYELSFTKDSSKK